MDTRTFLVEISYYTSGSYGDRDKEFIEKVVTIEKNLLLNIDSIRKTLRKEFDIQTRFKIEKMEYLGF